MNVFLLYLLLLKATLTSFSGLSSLPIIRYEFVEIRQVLTEEQLSAAVAAGRVTPGPAGLYVVSVGYFIAGIPGAIAGWFALITPSLTVILILRFLKHKANHPRIRSALNAIVLASAALLLAATLPLAINFLNGMILFCIAVLSSLILIFTRIDSLWVILSAALLSLISDAVQMLVY